MWETRRGRAGAQRIGTDGLDRLTLEWPDRYPAVDQDENKNESTENDNRRQAVPYYARPPLYHWRQYAKRSR